MSGVCRPRLCTGLARTLPALTGVRGVAALGVLWLHYAELLERSLGPQHAIVPPLHYGHLGVDLFFVLSGFVMAMVHMEDFARWDMRALRRFALARLFRIYPVHLTVLAAMAGLVFLLPGYADFACAARHDPATFDPANLAASLLLVQNWGFGFRHGWNGPAWSISAELLAYLAFPALAMLLLRLRAPRLCLAMALGLLTGIGLFMLAAHSHRYGDETHAAGLLRATAEFVAGMLILRFARIFPNRGGAGLGLLALAVMAGSLSLAFTKPLFYPALGMFIYALSSDRDCVARWMGGRFVVWLGDISFAVYLLHTPVIWLVHSRLPSRDLAASMPLQGVIVASTLLIVLLLADLAHRFIEQPCRDWGRRLARPLSAPGAHLA